MENGKKIGKRAFRLLTGVIVGGAIGSILGLTLAPKRGKETREYLRDRSMEMFLKGKAEPQQEAKIPLLKKILIRLLAPKKKS